MTKRNILLMSDSYKSPHRNMYVPKLQVVFSYLSSRGGVFSKTLYFGAQYYIKEYLLGQVITMAMIDEAEAFWTAHFFGRKDCFDRRQWEYIVKHHDGRLPIRICSVAEGTICDTGVVLMTIESTDFECAWLTNFIETLLMKVWYPITIATQSYHIKKDILSALNKSGTPEQIDFKCHDFGYRGVSSEETAALGGASHLLSFMGTDTVAGIRLLMDYYHAPMCGFSIPATEHSIMCSFGKDHELDAMKNLLDRYPSGLLACVSDTYDIYNACENLWGTILKDQILGRDGCLVIRPDSGDFFEVIPRILNILWDKFHGTVNEKVHKVLDPHVRLIQGDGMNPETIRELYSHIIHLGWSADNIAVGSGGGLLQTVNRDTQKFAIKASAAMVDGEWIDIFKSPVTDPGKKSLTGRFNTIKKDGRIYTVKSTENIPENILWPVYENGMLLRDFTLENVKNNIRLTEDLL